MKKLLIIGFLLVASPCYAQWPFITIDGHDRTKIDISEYNGISSAPSVSPSGKARIYFDSTTNTLRCSENGGAYTDCIGGGGGSGDVVGPASATDNAVARYDGTTGKLIQNSSVTIDDNGTTTVGGTDERIEGNANGEFIDFNDNGNGTITFGATGQTNNENIVYDLETNADALTYSSTTGLDLIIHPDNFRAVFGTGQDATIHYDGTNFRVGTTNGSLIFPVSDGKLVLQDAGTSVWNITADTGNDQVVVGTESASGHQIIFANDAHKDNNFDHVNAGSNTLVCVNSGTDPNTNNQQFGCFQHDTSNFEITVGTGNANVDTNVSIDGGTGSYGVIADGSTGGCYMYRDTDDAGWTECFALNGVQSCTVDADGVCDGS